MLLYHSALCYSCLILSWIAFKANAEKRSYMTYNMATICQRLQNFKIRMHHSSAGSTGILKSKDYLSEEEEMECVAKIVPPRGYGVIYHFESMYLRKDANNDCRDYLKLYTESSHGNNTSPICRDCCRFSTSELSCPGHCGQESDGLVCEEFCDKNNDTKPASTGIARSLTVHFHTRCGTCTSRKELIGFRMVFTAYKLNTVPDTPCTLPSEFKCDNGHCIWSGLTCDGYNNCGDYSDENKTGNSHCAVFPDPMKAVIIATAVIVTVLFMVVLAYFPKLPYLQSFFGGKRKTTIALRRSLEKKQRSEKNDLQRPPRSKSVSFQIPLPQIREVSISDSEV